MIPPDNSQLNWMTLQIPSSDKLPDAARTDEISFQADENAESSFGRSSSSCYFCPLS
jgi:hypothetical protein